MQDIDLQKLIKKIIRKSFPELKGVEVSGAYVKFEEDEDYCCIYSNDKGKYFIEMEEILRNEESSIVIAFLVHELLHIVWEKQSSRRYFNNDYALYEKYELHRKRDEQYTDLQVILRGYGKELKACNLKYYSRSRNGYLTAKDFKKLGI